MTAIPETPLNIEVDGDVIVNPEWQPEGERKLSTAAMQAIAARELSYDHPEFAPVTERISEVATTQMAIADQPVAPEHVGTKVDEARQGLRQLGAQSDALHHFRQSDSVIYDDYINGIPNRRSR